MHIHSKFGNTRALAFGAALLAGLAAAPAAHAQDTAPQREQRGERATPQERLDRRVAMLTERLSLNADQATRIRAILEQQGAEMQRLRGDRQGGGERPSREAMQAARASMQRYEQQIDAVLTDTQRATYKELRESQRRQMGGRGGAEGGRQGQPRS